ncbi:RNA polymerase sigma factor [Cerasicoccus arenae]|uniref:DNA-directed RNA polymerase sigma-70 factor n=1 Tax=Cerasicoccus arenae TaxID=424488 RepID=A0A8J3DFQ4_9BACT|nr:sigma-70 family RNA polymerase sigma factor [Cerasicoccus arenae]MBK1859932.1 sigma-70 family RNA polymerase sigma factor [Cerasicoccus arenae]GHB93478.1 DNA-directed RNA polymerase sigma-70 factor [Cerasicoccus arenae]
MKRDLASEPEPRLNLGDLFDQLEAPLLRFAYKLVMNAENAQDLVQEAFIRLVPHQTEVKKPRAWLYTTVHNLAMNQLRGQSKVVSLQSTVGGEDTTTPDSQLLPIDVLEQRERMGQIRVCLKRLPERERVLIQLKYHQNCSYREIAQQMGITVSNVGYSLHHALKSLEIELRQEGIAS